MEPRERITERSVVANCLPYKRYVMRLLSASLERVSERALDRVLYRLCASFTCLHYYRRACLYCVRKSTLLRRNGIALCQERWTDYVMSCASGSGGQRGNMLWSALNRLSSSEGTESVNPALKEGNILTEECVSTTLSFIVVLTFKRMNNKLFSIVLGNASKV